MIKGCNKRVIVMKDTGHEMIEEAFFILKPEISRGKGGFSEGDIMRQANLILDEKGFNTPLSSIHLNVNSHREKRGWFTPFMWGLVFGITITSLLAVFAV